VNDEVGLNEQIAAIERCINDFRWARGKAGDGKPEQQTYYALCAVAKDLRGRHPANASETLIALQRRIADAAATKTNTPGLGFDEMMLVGIGQEVIGRWPTVRQALQRLGAI
jgi:hypothetical protein